MAFSFVSIFFILYESYNEDKTGYAYHRIDCSHYLGKAQLPGVEGAGSGKQREGLEPATILGYQAGNKTIKATNRRCVDFGNQDKGIKQPYSRGYPSGSYQHGNFKTDNLWSSCQNRE